MTSVGKSPKLLYTQRQQPLGHRHSALPCGKEIVCTSKAWLEEPATAMHTFPCLTCPSAHFPQPCCCHTFPTFRQTVCHVLFLRQYHKLQNEQPREKPRQLPSATFTPGHSAAKPTVSHLSCCKIEPQTRYRSVKQRLQRLSDIGEQCFLTGWRQVRNMRRYCPTQPLLTCTSEGAHPDGDTTLNQSASAGKPHQLPRCSFHTVR